jgi:hypothetical protein
MNAWRAHCASMLYPRYVLCPDAASHNQRSCFEMAGPRFYVRRYCGKEEEMSKRGGHEMAEGSTHPFWTESPFFPERIVWLYIEHVSSAMFGPHQGARRTPEMEREDLPRRNSMRMVFHEHAVLVVEASLGITAKTCRGGAVGSDSQGRCAQGAGVRSRTVVVHSGSEGMMRTATLDPRTLRRL